MIAGSAGAAASLLGRRDRAVPHPPLRPRAPRARQRGRQRRRRGRAAAPLARAPRRARRCASCAPWIERRRARGRPRGAGGRARAGHGAVPGRDADAGARAGRARVHRRGDVLLVPAGDRAARRSSAGTGASAREEVAPRLDAATARAGTRYTGLTIRGQKHALGLVLVHGRDVVQLAAAARAAGDPRLRRRARGLPPRGDGPLAALLARCSPRARPAGATHSAWLRRYGSTLDALKRPPQRGVRALARLGSTSARRSGPSRRRPSRRRGRRARRGTRGPLSSIRAATRSSGLVAAAREGRPASRRATPRVLAPTSVERLVQRVVSRVLDLRPAADRDLDSSLHLGEQRPDLLPARDLAAVGALEASRRPRRRGSCP